MGLRLSELMNIPSLQDVHVVTGESLLETKKVEWVSIVELPVQNFIRKHELVLSSATNFRQDSDLSDQFVSDIIQSGATALAVASDNWTETLPQRIIDMANENQFILLLLNWKSSFSDIVQESLQVINEHNEKRREKTEALRIKLMDQVLNNSSLEALIKILYKEINIPVAISDEERSEERRVGKEC